MNGSRRDIDTLFSDSFRFFELLVMLVDEEPLDSFSPFERFQMQAIGIEKGKPFNPDERPKICSPMQHASAVRWLAPTPTRQPTPGVFYYPDRKWQHVPDGMTYTFTREGALQIDARNNVYYMAAGNSSSMMDKNIGQGSQYLWTYRDADGSSSTAARTTNSISCPTYRPTISGRLWSTTR